MRLVTVEFLRHTRLRQKEAQRRHHDRAIQDDVAMMAKVVGAMMVWAMMQPWWFWPCRGDGGLGRWCLGVGCDVMVVTMVLGDDAG